MLYEKASVCSFSTSNCWRTLPFMARAQAQGPAETRRANLKHILENRFRGRIADMARALDRDDAYLWQLLKGDRNAGERIARHIEGKLGLAKGALDSSGAEARAEISTKQEILLELFAGLFSLQQLELLRRMRALFDANQVTRKELGQKTLRGVSDAQIEGAFGAAPVGTEKQAKKIKPPKREPGTAMDDFLPE